MTRERADVAATLQASTHPGISLTADPHRPAPFPPSIVVRGGIKEDGGPRPAANRPHLLSLPLPFRGAPPVLYGRLVCPLASVLAPTLTPCRRVRPLHLPYYPHPYQSILFPCPRCPPLLPLPPHPCRRPSSARPSPPR